MIATSKVRSIEDIRDRAIENVYYNFDKIDKDFRKLFLYFLTSRCKSNESYIYISNLIETYEGLCEKRASKQKILTFKLEDLSRLFKMDLDNKF